MTAIVGGRVIDGIATELQDATVVFRDGRITDVRPDGSVPPDAGEIIDVDGDIVAPGLIDLHGDAFERSIMPRSAAPMPLDLALDDNARQLLATGISTAYLSATDSWEPGLRGRETLRAIVDAMRSTAFGLDLRLHVRRETTAVEGFLELAEWVSTGAVTMLSFADHTPDGVAPEQFTPSPYQLARSGCDASTFTDLTARAISHRDEGQCQDQALAWLARSVGCPTASHDGSTHEHVHRDQALGLDIAEFPMSIEIAEAYRAAGLAVVLGAPNLIRGGSHLGNLSVGDVVDPGAGDVLCSDYHYPSMLQAPFVAEVEGIGTLAECWKLVSSNAAAAAGLADRGTLEPGRRADIVVVDDGGSVSAATHLFVAGRLAYEAPIATPA